MFQGNPPLAPSTDPIMMAMRPTTFSSNAADSLESRRWARTPSVRFFVRLQHVSSAGVRTVPVQCHRGLSRINLVQKIVSMPDQSGGRHSAERARATRTLRGGQRLKVQERMQRAKLCNAQSFRRDESHHLGRDCKVSEFAHEAWTGCP